MPNRVNVIPQAPPRQMLPSAGAQNSRALLAQQLLAGGAQGGPVRSNIEGVARLAKTIGGTLLQNRVNADQETRAQRRNADLAEILAAGQQGGGIPAMLAKVQEIQNPDLADLAQTLAMKQIEIEQAAAQSEAQRRAKAAELVKVGASETLFDPRTGQPIFTGPAKSDEMSPGLFAQRQALAAMRKPLVTVSNKQESEFSKEVGGGLGKSFVAQVTGIRESAATAQDTRTKVRRARQLLDSGVNTGTLAPTRQLLKSMAKDAGVDLEAFNITDDVGAADALRSLGVDFALTRVQQTVGAISNAEMDLFQRAAVNLKNSEEGNRLILDMADRIAENQIKVNRVAREWQRANPSPGPADVAEFDALLDAFHEANPVFDEGMTQNIQDAITAGTVAPVAPQAPAAPQVKIGSRAVNPKTGEMLEWTGIDWRPVQ